MTTPRSDAWGTFLLRAAVLGAVIFGAVRLAIARDGVAGGAARSFVTVAGTVRGVTGTPTMTFRFRRAAGDGGVSPGLCEPTIPVLVREGGAFSVEVPLDSTTSRCPDDLFDGRDVSVELAVNGVPIVGTFAVNPVPYAMHADVAAVARQAEGASGSLESRILATEENLLTEAHLRQTGASSWVLLPGARNVRSITVLSPSDVQVNFVQEYGDCSSVSNGTPVALTNAACAGCVVNYRDNLTSSVKLQVRQMSLQDGGIVAASPNTDGFEVSLVVAGRGAGRGGCL